MKTLHVYVKPKSGKSKITYDKDKKVYVAYLKSAPVNNAANIELIHLIAKHFNISKINVKIVKGHKARYKIIKIEC